MQPYKARRERLAHTLGEGAVALIPGAVLRTRNADNDYLFRQDSDFYYLTGWNEPDALLVIEGGKRTRSTFFCAPKDSNAELWNGKRHGIDGAKKIFGFDKVYPNEPKEDVGTRLLRLIRNKVVIYCDRERSYKAMPELEATIDRSLTEHRMQAISERLGHIIGEMRVVKDDIEIALLRKAATISAEAHRAMLALVIPGMTEYELEAEITYRFRKAGGHPHHAYPPIVASGVNACTLHYNENARTIADGDLVLIDAGCELGGYASDITRTFPANGRFTHPQRAIYEIVLRAQHAALALARPGIPFSLLQDAAALIIVEELMRLSIMNKGDPHRAIAHGFHRAFYPHGVGHFLGLDVHDAGDYRWNSSRRKERLLEAGMVITVEPGIYIQPENIDVEPRWRGIGVRIEDDVLITRDGSEVLTDGAPKEITEIEKIMAKRASASNRK